MEEEYFVVYVDQVKEKHDVYDIKSYIGPCVSQYDWTSNRVKDKNNYDLKLIVSYKQEAIYAKELLTGMPIYVFNIPIVNKQRAIFDIIDEGELIEMGSLHITNKLFINISEDEKLRDWDIVNRADVEGISSVFNDKNNLYKMNPKEVIQILETYKDLHSKEEMQDFLNNIKKQGQQKVMQAIINHNNSEQAKEDQKQKVRNLIETLKNQS